MGLIDCFLFYLSKKDCNKDRCEIVTDKGHMLTQFVSLITFGLPTKREKDDVAIDVDEDDARLWKLLLISMRPASLLRNAFEIFVQICASPWTKRKMNLNIITFWKEREQNMTFTWIVAPHWRPQKPRNKRHGFASWVRLRKHISLAPVNHNPTIKVNFSSKYRVGGIQ